MKSSDNLKAHVLLYANRTYDSISIPAINQFFYFCQYDEWTASFYRGTKLHLSVNKNLIKEAYACIAPILFMHLDMFEFKIIDLSVPESRRGKRLSEGGQITLYFYQKNLETLAPKEEITVVLKKIIDALQEENIQPGKIPDSDEKTIFPYFSMRNDGGLGGNYYPARAAGKNSNPFHLPNVLDFLLFEKKATFDAQEHFAKFNKSVDGDLQAAFAATIIALVNETLRPEFVYPFLESSLEFEDMLLEPARLQKWAKEEASESDFYTLIFLQQEWQKLMLQRNSNKNFLGNFYLHYFFNNTIRFFKKCSEPKYIDNEMSYYILRDALKRCPRNFLFDQANKLIEQVFLLSPDLRNIFTLHTAKDSCSLFFCNNNPVEFSQVFLKQAGISAWYFSISISFRKFLKQYQGHFRSLLKIAKFTPQTLPNWDEEKLALLVYYHQEVKVLLKSGATLEMFSDLHLDALAYVLKFQKKLTWLCSVVSCSIPEFLKMQNKKISLLLEYSHHVEDVFSFYSLDFKRFQQLPLIKAFLFLHHGAYFVDEKKCPIDFEILVNLHEELLVKVFSSDLWQQKSITENDILRFVQENEKVENDEEVVIAQTLKMSPV